MATDGSPTPARVPQPVYSSVSVVHRIWSYGRNTNLVQGQKRIEFHNGEVVTEQNECGHVDDILWSAPQMREQFGSTRG